MAIVYRVTIDENGASDTVDYTTRVDAEQYFAKAKYRKGVFNIRLDRYDYQGANAYTLLFWERELVHD